MAIAIATLSELEAMANDATADYILTANIDATPTQDAGYNSGNGWATLFPDYSNKFHGSFDGDGYTIDGMHGTDGLFGYSRDGDGTVKNVSVTNAAFSDPTGNCAILCASTWGYNQTGYVADCFVSGTVTGGEKGTGALIGNAYMPVYRCRAEADVTAGAGEGRRVGGMFGYCRVSATDCGIVGSLTFPDYTNNDQIGGFAAALSGAATDCYASVSITMGTAVNASGFGGAGTGGSATNCFWDTTVGPSTSIYGTGKTTAEMKAIATYSTWDIVLKANHDGLQATAVWYVEDGVAYPELYFEYVATSGTDDLTSSELTGSAPTLDSPTIGQTHALTGSELTGAAPTLDTPTLGQTHSLTGTELTSSAPLLDSPTLAEGTDNLTSTDLTGGAPTLDTPSIGQTHALSATELTGAAPTLDTPSIGQAHALTGTELTGGTPTLDSPTISETVNTDALTSTDLTGSAPTLDSPTIGQVHALTGVDVLGGVSLDSPTLGQTHALTGTDLTGSAPVLGTPVLIYGAAEGVATITWAAKDPGVAWAATTPGVAWSGRAPTVTFEGD